MNPTHATVLHWLKHHPQSTAQEIGDALYDQCCRINRLAKYRGNPAATRREWALYYLRPLMMRGLIERGRVPWRGNPNAMYYSAAEKAVVF